MNKCMNCDYWEANYDELPFCDGQRCFNDSILDMIHNWETELPRYIKPNIMKSFITKPGFSCNLFKNEKGLTYGRKEY